MKNKIIYCILTIACLLSINSVVRAEELEVKSALTSDGKGVHIEYSTTTGNSLTT